MLQVSSEDDQPGAHMVERCGAGHPFKLSEELTGSPISCFRDSRDRTRMGRPHSLGEETEDVSLRRKCGAEGTPR